jgi:hypothetical protein
MTVEKPSSATRDELVAILEPALQKELETSGLMLLPRDTIDRLKATIDQERSRVTDLQEKVVEQAEEVSMRKQQRDLEYARAERFKVDYMALMRERNDLQTELDQVAAVNSDLTKLNSALDGSNERLRQCVRDREREALDAGAEVDELKDSLRITEGAHRITCEEAVHQRAEVARLTALVADGAGMRELLRHCETMLLGEYHKAEAFELVRDIRKMLRGRRVASAEPAAPVGAFVGSRRGPDGYYCNGCGGLAVRVEVTHDRIR